MPAQLTLVPAETLAAQTMAAMPRTDTPGPPTEALAPTATIDRNTPTPSINLAAPGAYCLPTNTERISGLVTRVLDAETIEVATGNTTYRVRYIGLDAPNIAPVLEWRAAQAISTNEMLVSGRRVVLVKDVSETDANGNYLRYVMVGDTFVNYQLIQKGFSRVAITPPDVACQNSFLAAQVEAQAGIRGLWEATPVPTYTITPTPTITRTPTETRIPQQAVCNCTGPRLTCNDFRSRRQAQACFEYCYSQGYGDIFRLDKNRNGIACDGSQ